MSDTKLGILIKGEQHRDAIHIAVAPVTSDEVLIPGLDVALVEGRSDKVGTTGAFIGIVDPFLKKEPILPGQKFWLVLYPQTITSLRHEWTHPAFASKSADGTSQRWIESFANEVGISCNMLMAAADNWLRSKGYLDIGDELPEGPKIIEFWHHYEVVTGKNIAEEKQHSFFTCSC